MTMEDLESVPPHGMTSCPLGESTFRVMPRLKEVKVSCGQSTCQGFC